MEKSTVALSVITAALVGYVVYEQMTPETAVDAPVSTDVVPSPVGRSRALGLSRRARRSRKDTKECRNAKIGTPAFARCATQLGAGRNVIPGDPLNAAHNINTAFVNDEFTSLGSTRIPGNINTGFVNDEFTSLGGAAFPFTDTATSRETKSDSRHLDFPTPNALQFKLKGGGGGTPLGAAVSPSAMGASREEILKSSRRAIKTTVSSNIGGQLNLLHPLE